MARLTNIPLQPLIDLASGIRGAHERRRECVRVAIEVDRSAPSELVRGVKGALMPETSTGLVHVSAIDPAAPVRVNTDTDLAIIVAGEAKEGCALVARAFATSGVACAVVVETSVEAPTGEGLDGVALISAVSSEALLSKLASWMADACPRDIALAANFPFCRHAVALRCIRDRSAQNAVVSLMPFGDSDLPVMGLNQALMALDIASAYGRGVEARRAIELAFVVACALGSRAVARSCAKALPGLGILVRLGVAYGGTALMGLALACAQELVPYEADDAQATLP